MKKKISRLDFISSGKGTITKNYELKKKKIKRTIEGMIDDAEEKSESARDKAENILNSIKDVADDTDKIAQKFNQYIDAINDSEGYLKSKTILEQALKKLDDKVEVEVDDEEEKKSLLKD